MSKKGAGTFDNFLSIVLAVIGIALIIYFGYKVWFIIHTNNEVENAQRLADNIIGKLGILNNGESNEFLFRGVDGWYIVGWSKGDNLDDKPDKCSFDSCICVCPSSDKDSCQEKGVCRVIDAENVKVNSTSYEILGSYSAGEGGVSSKFGYVQRGCVRLSSLLIPLELGKTENGVFVSYDSNSTKYSAGSCLRG